MHTTATKTNLIFSPSARSFVAPATHTRQEEAVGRYNFASTPVFPRSPQTCIQPKLTINEPGDSYEQEADAMADRVMRMSELPLEKDNNLLTKPLTAFSPAVGGSMDVQRKCAACEKAEEESLQTKPLMRKATGGGYTTSTHLSSQLGSSKGGGNPLPGQTLTSMNRAFGADFSNVRIHSDSRAAEMSQSIQAKAFTHGSDVYFNRDHYSLESGEGRRLLAHELTHVVQQQGSSSKKIFRQPAAPRTCPFDERKRQELLNKPLPWGIQSGDSQQTIITKRKQMARHADFLPFLGKCVTENITGIVTQQAENTSIQDLINGMKSGQPFIVVRRTEGGRIFEAIANPIPLPGSGESISTLKHRITGDDASQDATVTMPGLATPQCGDECTSEERHLTVEQFKDNGTPVRSCCSVNECTVINDKIKEAETHTALAMERMKKGDAMENAIKKHFKKSDEGTYRDVLEGLSRIRPSLGFSQHSWVCRQYGNAAEACKSTTDIRKNIGGRAEGWRIQLCFNEGNVPWEDVLHEIAHAAHAGGRETYYGTDGYPPDDALENADSYAMFVKEIGAPGWQEEHGYTGGIKAQGGLSVSGGQAKPVLGARVEWTPMGPGMRIIDFAVGASFLWSPDRGVLPSEEDTGGTEFFGGLEAVGRIRPSRSLYFDIGVGGVLAKSDQFDTLGVSSRLSAMWKPGGKSSGLSLGIDFSAVYREVKARPDQLIIGVSAGFDFGGEPRRRARMKP